MKKERKAIEIDYYITEDGRSFTNEYDAKDHEKTIRYNKIAKEFNTYHDFPFELFGVEFENGKMICNNDQLEYVKDKYKYVNLNDDNNDFSEMVVGDWICEASSGNNDVDGCIYTLRYLLYKMNKFVEYVESQTVHGQF